jgi:probable rRNA maturation factor
LECNEKIISLLITDDREIAELNGKYRNKLTPTDVLSFPSGTNGYATNQLGDVVISVDRAIRQAKERNLHLEQEMVRLLIHGTLHLLGYDHEGVPPTERRKMRREEERLYRISSSRSE